jgi:hypothetical protein
MKHQRLYPERAGSAVIAVILMISLPLLIGFAGTRDKAAKPERTQKDAVESSRTRLNAYARHLAGRSPAVPGDLEMPARAVFQIMGPDERKGLAVGAARMHDRLLSTNVCSIVEIEWEKRTLSLLRMRDGDEVAALIRRVHYTPAHQIGSLEKIGQIETLMRAVYPEMVADGEAEPVPFERSDVKKALMRRQFLLMRGGGQ